MDCTGKTCQSVCGNLLHSVFLGVTRVCSSIVILPAERFLCGSAGGKVLVSTCLACIYFERILLAGTASRLVLYFYDSEDANRAHWFLYMPVWFSSSHLKVSLLLPALSILITMFPAGAEFLFLVPTASSLDFWLSHEECLLWSFTWKNSLHKPKMPITRQPVAYNSRPGEVCCWHKGLNERQMWTNRPCGQRVRVQASTNRKHFRKDFMLHRKGKEWTRRNALAKGNVKAWQREEEKIK